MRVFGYAVVVGLALAQTYCANIQTAFAQSPEAFFKGRTVTLVIGFDVGGSLDAYARLFARHIGQFMPGQPNLVPQNMLGASGLTAANYIYQSAAKDGSVLGVIHPNSPFAQAIGMDSILYDARRFNWLGRLTSNTSVFYTWKTSATKTLEDLLHRETLVGGIGPLTDGVIFSRMANEVLGTRFKMINGYKGTAAANLAMEQGEVDGVFNIWEGMKSLNADWLRSGTINLIAQFVQNRHPELPNVPTIYDVATTDDQRQVLRLFLSTAEIGRSIVMPPDVPADRVSAWRTAFDDMVRDPEFQADAANLKMELNPLSGIKLQKLVEDTFKTPPSAVATAQRIMKD